MIRCDGCVNEGDWCTCPGKLNEHTTVGELARHLRHTGDSLSVWHQGDGGAEEWGASVTTPMGPVVFYGATLAEALARAVVS